MGDVSWEPFSELEPEREVLKGQVTPPVCSEVDVTLYRTFIGYLQVSK